MPELEDIVLRKNYALKIDWSCTSCGSPTEVVGCVIEGERFFEDRKSQVTWDDILHKKCKKCGLIEKPDLKCNKCHTQYKFGVLGCNICDKEISNVLEIQDNICIIKEQVKQDNRKKINTDDLISNVVILINKLKGMGYLPCTSCGIEFVKNDSNYNLIECFECKKIDGQ